MASTANEILVRPSVEQGNRSYDTLISKINELKEQIQADRILTIKEKLKNNENKLESCVQQTLSATSRNIFSAPEKGLACLSTENSIYLAKPVLIGTGDKHFFHHTLNYAGSRLPYIEKLPRYTTWTHLRRNQRMAEHHPVVGMQCIYYDQSGKEVVICSDSEEEIAEARENVKGDENTKSGETKEMEVEAKTSMEDNVKVVDKRHKFSEGEIRILWMAFQEYGCDEEVANILAQHIGGTAPDIQEQYNKMKEKSQNHKKKYVSESCLPLEKRLGAAMDSVDSLFCRFCLVFDCQLHDSSLSVIPSEKQQSWSEPKDAEEPCSDQCYLLARQAGEMFPEGSDVISLHQVNDAAREVGKLSLPCNSDHMVRERDEEKPEIGQAASALGAEALGLSYGCKWKPLEKDLFIKGLEIFGRNSCLIMRNLIFWRSCVEVFNYMQYYSPPSTLLSEGKGKDSMDIVEEKTPSRSFRRRGGMRRHKSSSKTVARFPWLKKIGNGKHRVQYTPCDCQIICGKDCTCLRNKTCCEKYCGCSKRCKNRYRGCHCVKGQCRNKQCPCFSLDRECDPDVCRNCWVSCGGNPLGEPRKQGEGPCGNMNILLRQQRQILLGRSDVAGWGVFAKKSVKKNDYLGEYTGELIDHDEADRRGTLYDRADSSYLFDLNDQWVLDACRKGHKLKFANHSFEPNCYCKIMQVGADHRVGIFANQRIESGRELFYDYSYEEDACPVWARKPEPEDRGKNEASTSIPHSRAKKNHTRGQLLS